VAHFRAAVTLFMLIIDAVHMPVARFILQSGIFSAVTIVVQQTRSAHACHAFHLPSRIRFASYTFQSAVTLLIHLSVALLVCQLRLQQRLDLSVGTLATITCSPWRVLDVLGDVEIMAHSPHLQAVSAVLHQPRSNIILSGGCDGTIKAWDMELLRNRLTALSEKDDALPRNYCCASTVQAHRDRCDPPPGFEAPLHHCLQVLTCVVRGLRCQGPSVIKGCRL
jgi:hypothetical protein